MANAADRHSAISIRCEVRVDIRILPVYRDGTPAGLFHGGDDAVEECHLAIRVDVDLLPAEVGNDIGLAQSFQHAVKRRADFNGGGRGSGIGRWDEFRQRRRWRRWLKKFGYDGGHLANVGGGEEVLGELKGDGGLGTHATEICGGEEREDDARLLYFGFGNVDGVTGQEFACRGLVLRENVERRAPDLAVLVVVLRMERGVGRIGGDTVFAKDEEGAGLEEITGAAVGAGPGELGAKGGIEGWIDGGVLGGSDAGEGASDERPPGGEYQEASHRVTFSGAALAAGATAFDAVLQVTKLEKVAAKEVAVAGIDAAVIDDGLETGDGLVESGRIVVTAFPTALEVGEAIADAIETAHFDGADVVKAAFGAGDVGSDAVESSAAELMVAGISAVLIAPGRLGERGRCAHRPHCGGDEQMDETSHRKLLSGA